MTSLSLGQLVMRRVDIGYYLYYYCAPGGLRSIVMSRPMSVCLSVFPLLQLENDTVELHETFRACCLWPQLGPPLTALRYACTSSFMDDVTCSHTALRRVMCIAKRRAHNSQGSNNRILISDQNQRAAIVSCAPGQSSLAAIMNMNMNKYEYVNLYSAT